MNGPSRKVSEKFGGIVYLCPYHHTLGGKNCVHENYELREELKREFQSRFLEDYDLDMWMKLFRKNYMED